jgi:hypothetical protein
MFRRVIIALSLSMAACGGSSSDGPSVNASGNYTGSVTYGVNSCPGAWSQGDTAMMDLTVTQTDQGSVSLQMKGPFAVVVQLILGASTLTGTVSGSEIHAVYISQNRITDASTGCTFIWAGDLGATVAGDALSGTLRLKPQMVVGTSCDVFMTCSRDVAINETRMH